MSGTDPEETSRPRAKLLLGLRQTGKPSMEAAPALLPSAPQRGCTAAGVPRTHRTHICWLPTSQEQHQGAWPHSQGGQSAEVAPAPSPRAPLPHTWGHHAAHPASSWIPCRVCGRVPGTGVYSRQGEAGPFLRRTPGRSPESLCLPWSPEWGRSCGNGAMAQAAGMAGSVGARLPWVGSEAVASICGVFRRALGLLSRLGAWDPSWASPRATG